MRGFFTIRNCRKVSKPRMLTLMRNFAVTLVLLVALTACSRSETVAPVDATAANTTSSRTATDAVVPASPAPAVAAQRLDVGSTMPAYTATNLDGSGFDLAAKKDKVLLLNIWATWCGPCRYEIPELQKIHDRFEKRGFEVVGVSVDESGAQVVEPFVEEQKMTYPVVLDPRGQLADMLETSVLPTTVLVDRSGKIVWKKLGLITANDTTLEQAIEAAL